MEREKMDQLVELLRGLADGFSQHGRAISGLQREHDAILEGFEKLAALAEHVASLGENQHALAVRVDEIVV